MNAARQAAEAATKGLFLGFGPLYSDANSSDAMHKGGGGGGIKINHVDVDTVMMSGADGGAASTVGYPRRGTSRQEPSEGW